MADSEIIRRLIEQASGQGGPAFATAMPSTANPAPPEIGNNPAFQMQADRSGQTIDEYWNGLHPEAQRQNLARQGVADGSNMPLDAPRSGIQHLGPHTGVDIRAHQPREAWGSDPVGASSIDSFGGARQAPVGPQMPQDPDLLQMDRDAYPRPMRDGQRPAANPFGTVDRLLNDPRTMQPESEPRNAPGSVGGPSGLRYPGDLGNPIGGLAIGDDANARMMFDMWGQAPAQSGLPGAAMADTSPQAAGPNTPSTLAPPPPGGGSGGIAGGGSGSIAGIGSGTSRADAMSAGLPDPRAPEAFDPETGTRDGFTRGTGILDRIFGADNVDRYLGEEGSDQRRNTGKALMSAGAVMMQHNGDFGQAIGAGIQAGLTTYDEAMQAIRDEEKEMRQMGMQEEAHELSMELQRLQLQRLRATPMPGSGKGGGGGGGTANLGRVGQAMRDYEMLDQWLGGSRSPEAMVDMALGGAGLYPRGSPDPFAGLTGN